MTVNTPEYYHIHRGSFIAVNVDLQILDKDEDGAINAKELKRVLKQFGEPLDDDDIQEMIALAGVDEDGNVNCFGKTLRTMLYGRSCVSIPQPRDISWRHNDGSKNLGISR